VCGAGDGWVRGYLDSANYLVNLDDKKIEGPFGQKISRKSRNSCEVNGWSCECMGTVDSRPKCSHSWNQIKTLKECLFCHIHCADLWPRLVSIVTASCAVSYRESWYPRGSPRPPEVSSTVSKKNIPPMGGIFIHILHIHTCIHMCIHTNILV